MKTSLFERFLMKVLPFFDITKEVEVVCETCGGRGAVRHCPQEGCNAGFVKEKVVYLRRFFLWRSKSGSVYLHHFFRSDDDPDPHDHPWDFTSLILKGGYRDEQWLFTPNRDVKAGEVDGLITGKFPNPKAQTVPGFLFKADDELCRPGDIVHRNAEHIHRAILPEGKTAWTLVFTGPVRRSWGFIQRTGWVFWRLYLNVWDKSHATD